TNEGGYNFLDTAFGDIEPVATREGCRLRIGLQIVLKLLDVGLDFILIDVRLGGGDELRLDLVDGLIHRVHGGIGDIDLCGSESKRVVDGGHRVVVGAHGGGN